MLNELLGLALLSPPLLFYFYDCSIRIKINSYKK